MKINCVWEHNGQDTLLYPSDFLGAYTRGKSLEAAKEKMQKEILSFALWADKPLDDDILPCVTQEKTSDLQISDADSDVIFDCEKAPLLREEYEYLKRLAIKSAEDFLALYNSVPDKNKSCLSPRKTFYGNVPRTATEMYEHTKNVTAYYFEEIDVEADNAGNIVECRKRGFEEVEKRADFLENKICEGSYGETWSLKKVLRRFVWHDRIHAKAMYRMAVKTFGYDSVLNVFKFD